MSEKQEKKWSEIVKEERDKGNVVYLCIDEVLSAPVKEIIKQPAEGLLWDLNRDEVTALTLMDKEGMIHWVNNFAVARVIKELKRQLDEALVENAALKRENEALHILRDKVDWFTNPHREIFDGTTIRCELCEAWEKYEVALLTAEEQDEQS